MLKTASATDSANKNLERGSQRVQVENRDEKKPIQKSCKSQKMVKSKNSIHVKKAEISRVKNLGQSDTFVIANAKKAFTKLRQMFIKALILNYFDPEHHIQIETDVSGYTIGEIFY